MPKLDPSEHKRRKEATALRCLDINGKPVNDASKSVAVQDKRDSCDINRIVKKVTRPDGQIDAMTLQSIAKAPGRYGDFTGAADFQEVSNRVIRMNNAFMALPAETRLKFDNDPAKMIEFVTNPANEDESVKLGLLPPPVWDRKKIETPEGFFWVTTKNDIEVKREPVKPVATAPVA